MPFDFSAHQFCFVRRINFFASSDSGSKFTSWKSSPFSSKSTASLGASSFTFSELKIASPDSTCVASGSAIFSVGSIFPASSSLQISSSTGKSEVTFGSTPTVSSPLSNSFSSCFSMPYPFTSKF